MHLHEVPGGVIGVENGDHKAAFLVARQERLEAELLKPRVNGVVDTRVARPLGGFAFGKIFLQGLNRGVDRLNGRREVHLARLLEVVVLEEQIAVVAALRVVRRRLDEVRAADDEAQARHRLQPLLRRGHAKVDVVALDVDRPHGKRRRRVHGEGGAVLMGEGADFSDGIEKPRARFVVRCVHKLHVGVRFERFLHLREIRLLRGRKREIDDGHAVVAADFHGTRAVGAVVDDQDLAAFRQEGIEAHVDVERSGAAEKNGRVLFGIGVDGF